MKLSKRCVLYQVSNSYKWTSLTLYNYISLSFYSDTYVQRVTRRHYFIQHNTFLEDLRRRSQLLCVSLVEACVFDDEKCFDSVRASMLMIMFLKPNCVTSTSRLYIHVQYIIIFVYNSFLTVQLPFNIQQCGLNQICCS